MRAAKEKPQRNVNRLAEPLEVESIFAPCPSGAGMAERGLRTSNCFVNASRGFKVRFEGSYRSYLTTPGGSVIALGVILLIIGFIAKIAILWVIGIVLLVIGLVLALMGMMGRAVGGRAHYY